MQSRPGFGLEDLRGHLMKVLALALTRSWPWHLRPWPWP